MNPEQQQQQRLFEEIVVPPDLAMEVAFTYYPEVAGGPPDSALTENFPFRVDVYFSHEARCTRPAVVHFDAPQYRRGGRMRSGLRAKLLVDLALPKDLQEVYAPLRELGAYTFPGVGRIFSEMRISRTTTLVFNAYATTRTNEGERVLGAQVKSRVGTAKLPAQSIGELLHNSQQVRSAASAEKLRFDLPVIQNTNNIAPATGAECTIGAPRADKPLNKGRIEVRSLRIVQKSHNSNSTAAEKAAVREQLRLWTALLLPEQPLVDLVTRQQKSRAAEIMARVLSRGMQVFFSASGRAPLATATLPFLRRFHCPEYRRSENYTASIAYLTNKSVLPSSPLYYIEAAATVLRRESLDPQELIQAARELLDVSGELGAPQYAFIAFCVRLITFFPSSTPYLEDFTNANSTLSSSGRDPRDEGGSKDNERERRRRSSGGNSSSGSDPTNGLALSRRLQLSANEDDDLAALSQDSLSSDSDSDYNDDEDQMISPGRASARGVGNAFADLRDPDGLAALRRRRLRAAQQHYKQKLVQGSEDMKILRNTGADDCEGSGGLESYMQITDFVERMRFDTVDVRDQRTRSLLDLLALAQELLALYVPATALMAVTNAKLTYAASRMRSDDALAHTVTVLVPYHQFCKWIGGDFKLQVEQRTMFWRRRKAVLARRDAKGGAKPLPVLVCEGTTRMSPLLLPLDTYFSKADRASGDPRRSFATGINALADACVVNDRAQQIIDETLCTIEIFCPLGQDKSNMLARNNTDVSNFYKHVVSLQTTVFAELRISDFTMVYPRGRTVSQGGQRTYGITFNDFVLPERAGVVGIVPTLLLSQEESAVIDMLVGDDQPVPELHNTARSTGGADLHTMLAPANSNKSIPRRLLAIERRYAHNRSVTASPPNPTLGPTVLQPRKIVVSVRARDIGEPEITALEHLATLRARGNTSALAGDYLFHRISVHSFRIADATVPGELPFDQIDVEYFF